MAYSTDDLAHLRYGYPFAFVEVDASIAIADLAPIPGSSSSSPRYSPHQMRFLPDFPDRLPRFPFKILPLGLLLSVGSVFGLLEFGATAVRSGAEAFRSVRR